MYLSVFISPIENSRFRSGKKNMTTCVRNKKKTNISVGIKQKRKNEKELNPKP
jgi:hypothetical protein